MTIGDAKGRNIVDGISRRTALGTMAAAGAVLAAPATLRAQETTIRWWSPQSSPGQLAAYQTQIELFEAANPGVKVAFEKTSDEGYQPQLAAAFASGEVPNVVTHLPSFAVSDYWSNDLLEPFNEVIEAVGPEKYYRGANDIYEIDEGIYAGSGIGNSAANMLWVRKDLMEQAGVDKIPETWDELRAALQKMQGGGIYGAPLPYAKNSMTTLTIIGFIHLAGGQVFTPDLEVALDSDETRNALDFYKSMRELCPPGATNYSWGESLTAFVSGATATGIYTGRALINVNEQNPPIADHVTCATYPTISKDVPSWTFNDFPSVFIPKQAGDMEVTKAFAASLYDGAGYIQQLHAAPGHVLPVLKTVAEDPAYLDNPIIEKYTAEVELMSAAAAAGHNLGWESPEHKPNVKAGAVVGSGVLAEMVQRVVLNDEDAGQVIGETVQAIEEIMKA
ncbi:MAG: ABC transporter substrate-binding protein [Alphaproteobacteria bacterium]|nr:ABC transporter substrate-binding protein [Alphaproteobacteria bacterium]